MTKRTESQETTVSPIDVRTRVVALALEPALSLARMAALPLDDVQRLVSVGYFREARSRGMSFRAIARRFGKSVRTITNLSKQANDQGLPLEESETLSYRRQMVVLVGAKRGQGLSKASLLAAFPNADPADLDAELEYLLGSGVLEASGGHIRASAKHLSMMEEDLGARLESFRHFLRAITLVAHRRFFVVEQEKEAFARVLSFGTDAKQLAELRETVYESLRTRAIAADEGAADSEAATTAMATFCVVEESDDPAWRPPRQ